MFRRDSGRILQKYDYRQWRNAKEGMTYWDYITIIEKIVRRWS